MIISPSYQKMNHLGLASTLFSLLFLLLSACTYRFTNLYLRPPPGVRSIAIEAVYDTSHKVVPHELLWESLQKEFAADGRLYLAAPAEADVYLRAQLVKAVVAPHSVSGEIKKDPRGELDHFGRAYPPLAFGNLKQAQRFATAESLELGVKVEVWHLAKKKLLMQRTYTSQGSHKVYDATIPSESRFVKAQEGFEELFANLAEQVAKTAVRDFLSLSFDDPY